MYNDWFLYSRYVTSMYSLLVLHHICAVALSVSACNILLFVARLWNLIFSYNWWGDRLVFSFLTQHLLRLGIQHRGKCWGVALLQHSAATVHLWWDERWGRGWWWVEWWVRGEFWICICNLNLQYSTLSSTIRCLNLLWSEAQQFNAIVMCTVVWVSL